MCRTWRYTALAAALALSLALAGQEPPKDADDDPGPPVSPESHVRLALAHALTLPEANRPHVRYLSLWDVPAADVWTYRRYLAWWIHQLTFERAVSLPEEVPGSRGRLVWVDLRNYGWNARSWRAVAERDPRAREPWLQFKTAEALRSMAGYEGVQPDKDETRAVLGMVNAAWFLRETMETRRSTSYYDLLFARQRFPDGGGDEAPPREPARGAPGYSGPQRRQPFPRQSIRQPFSMGFDPGPNPPAEERVVVERGGGLVDVARSEVRPGEVVYVRRGGALQREGAAPAAAEKPPQRAAQKQETAQAAVDFPKDTQEWEKAFGVSVLRAFAKETRIDLDFGAVVAGDRDDPNGSIVALNNRLVVVIPGPFGWAMRTFDAAETSGGKDYGETLIFKNGKFVKGDGADAENDGGELLAYLPNGGQAGFLVNGEGKRVEVAASEVANDTADKKLNPGVRNYGSCVTCHAGAGGFIEPKDTETEDRKLGIKRKFKDKKQEQRYREFFEDWVDGSKASTSRYEKLITKTTVHPRDPRAKAWTGSDIAKLTGQIRAAYDAPVTPERAARELGIPVEMFKLLCSRSPKHRMQQFVRGKAIPSATWEKDCYKEVGKLLDLFRSDPEYKRFGRGE